MNKKTSYSNHLDKRSGFHFLFYILSITVLVIVCCGDLYSREREKPTTTKEQIESEYRFLEKFKSRYKLFAIDLFEHKRPWAARASSSMLSRVTYIRKKPETPDYIQEQKLINRFISTNNSFHKSLSIHTSFDLPGFQNYNLLVKEDIELKARPVQISMWVHSNGYKHTLFVNFKSKKNKSLLQKITQLNFFGWQRFHIKLPVSFFKSEKIQDQSKRHLFKGFVIKSHARQKAGAMNVFIENLLIISDLQEFQYPGSQINDNWD